ncbi:ubiquitin-specific protease doa4 [Orbilia blumenaviensis]|uniref:ubiquitinyl hydrolase 1 n=1 Tax=Orbilia blumenaviensis TaxID=1796055 RepID=A0AAV9UPE9_9PEZI
MPAAAAATAITSSPVTSSSNRNSALSFSSVSSKGTTMTSAASLSSSAALAASGGGGGGGGNVGGGSSKRVLMHIDELKVRVAAEKPSSTLSIATLLMLAQRRFQASKMNIDFHRLDLAFVDFNVSMDILINVIPHHREYPTWINRNLGNSVAEFKALKEGIKMNLDRMDKVKRFIIEDNIKNSTQSPLSSTSSPPAADRPPTSSSSSSSMSSSTVPVAPKEDPSTAAPNGHPAVLTIKKPPPRPAKSKDLQNYHHATEPRQSTDRPPSRGLPMPGGQAPPSSSSSSNPTTGRASHDLRERFEKLRVSANGLPSSPSPSRLQSSDPAGLRRRLPSIPGIPTALSTDEASLPRPPSPTYSPIRQFPDGSSYFPVPGDSQARPLVRAASNTSLDMNYVRPSSAASVPIAPLASSTISSKPAAAPMAPTNTGDATISAERLSEWLGRVAEMSVLVIDVRERTDFDQGHIFARDIICIEPTALRDNMSALQLEDALSLSPDREQALFKRRSEYDFVVYHDQSSAALTTYLPGVDKQSQRALKVLVQAIHELAYEKQLKNPPKLLVGGLHAWVEFNGMPSLVQTTATVTQKAGLARAGAKTTATSQSTLAARRKERARVALPGQVLPDEKRSELNDAQPINQEEEAQWYARLKRENTAITVKRPAGLDTSDIKSHNRSASLVGLDFDRSPDIEEFFQRFPAIGQNHLELPIVPARAPPSPPPEGASQQSSAYPVLPLLGSAGQAGVSPASSVHEEPSHMPPPTRAPPPVPPPVPLKETVDTGLTRRNTIIDHVFHGFTDVQNPHFHPVTPTSPSRPPPAVPKKSYSGVSEHHQPQAPALDSISVPFITPVGPTGFGTTGLKNLGNTCYMNSIIQCMSGTVPLARYFLSGFYKGHLNRENRLGSRGIFAEAFANLNRNLWEETYAFVSPVTIKDISGRLNSQFRGKDQQDAQEYLEFFLDYLHEDLNANAGKPRLRELTDEEEKTREKLPVQLASHYEWERYVHTNLSMIVKWFQGQFRSRLKCLKCGHTSTTYSPFMYLSLPIPAKAGPNGCTLKDCMDEFTKEEILDGDDAWHCPVCKKPRKASKQLSISRMPIVLIIHLKRFSSHGMWRDKVNTLVNFGKSVDLTRYVPPPLDPKDTPGGVVLPKNSEVTPPFYYSLYAVTNHYGSLTSGHYTAFVRVGGGTGGREGGVWNKFDDTKATKMEGEDVVNRNAYILFWVRNGVM